MTDETLGKRQMATENCALINMNMRPKHSKLFLGNQVPCTITQDGFILIQHSSGKKKGPVQTVVCSSSLWIGGNQKL
jgi:hypothetical protein